MPTLPQRAAPSQLQSPPPQWPALTAALDRMDRPMQRKAICTWHQRNSLAVLNDEIAAHDHFPLIACNDQAHAFAPARGTPRPAA